MAYEFTRSGLGFSDPRGACSEVTGGETRCFRAREAAAATSHRCRSTTQTCTVGGDAGTVYCCPQFGSVRASGPATTPEGGGALTQAANALKGILGFGVSQTTDVNTEAANEKGAPSAQGFSNYVKNAAVAEAAAVEEDVMGPAEDAPGGSSGNWISRYQTHITIASTAIGLATFVIWLVVRKK
jgi:hypothetical protein